MKKYLGNNCTVQMITYERSIKNLVQEKAALHDHEVMFCQPSSTAIVCSP